MERLIVFFRANPVLTGLTLFLVISIGLGIFIATLMTKAGLSLKPLVFFYVFLGIIVAPQLAYHWLKARGIAPELVWTPDDGRARAAEIESALTHGRGKYDHPEKVFGPGFDPDLVSDVSRLFSAQNPLIAQMVIFRNAETAIVARFPTEETALDALRYYAAMLGQATLPAASADGSFAVARGTDLARLFVAGKTLFIWTAADQSALDRRMKASASTWMRAPAAPGDPQKALWWKIMAGATLLLVIIATLWFFKGSSWAASIKPDRADRVPAAAFELKSRLMEIESLKLPVKVTAGTRADEIVVTWRTDAAWLDLARARGLRRTHKIVLQLDETHHDARVTEYASRLDWSAGAGGGDFSWYAERGVIFFQSDYHRIYGLQLDPGSGRLKPALSYSYQFNLQELKVPLISAVTHAGWTWKPVIWQSPEWLRWAVE